MVCKLWVFDFGKRVGRGWWAPGWGRYKLINQAPAVTLRHSHWMLVLVFAHVWWLTAGTMRSTLRKRMQEISTPTPSSFPSTSLPLPTVWFHQVYPDFDEAGKSHVCAAWYYSDSDSSDRSPQLFYLIMQLAELIEVADLARCSATMLGHSLWIRGQSRRMKPPHPSSQPYSVFGTSPVTRF